MAAWPDVEELVTLWLADASQSAREELAEIEEEQEELRHMDCGCRSCRKIAWAEGFELHEMWEATAMELLPLLRLGAANRSTRALKRRG